MVRSLVFGVLVVVLAGAAGVIAFEPAAANPLGDIQAVSAGQVHTCALTAVGGIKCWGDNYYGELGDGSTNPTTRPVDVPGLIDGATAISVGGVYTCALTMGGGVTCWGDNSSGQLGNASTASSNTPVDVTGLTTGVATISTGNAHTCALTAGGGVKCWGWNFYGQLGNSTTMNSSIPVDVTGLTSGVAAVTTGEGHTCAITTSGEVKCWGWNSYGQLGNGTTTNSSSPVDVIGLSNGVVAVSAGGYHTCALTAGGGVKCWGGNFAGGGQLGNGTYTNSSVPVDVLGLSSGASAVTGGRRHTCALTTIGGVKCWGDNKEGQLGDGTMNGSSTPVNVAVLTGGVAAISAGYYHTCAITSEGVIECWGENHQGQLGDGKECGVDCPTPVIVSNAKPTPTPTHTPIPTPTPPSVGGVAFDPGGGGSSASWPWAIVGFASAAAAVGTALLVHRRRLR